MSEIDELEDPRLSELVAAEKERPDPLPDTAPRIMSRLAVSLDLGTGAPVPPVAAPVNVAPLASSSARAWVMFAVGAVAGAAGHATVARLIDRPPLSSGPGTSAARPRPVAPPPEAPPPPTEPAADPSIGKVDAAGPQTERRTIRSTRVPAGEPAPAPSIRSAAALDANLRAERKVIEMARTAVSRGQYDDAVSHLRKHAKLFPDGELQEEREGLLVQALVGHGDAAEARARAQRFHARFPRSLFGPAVDAAVRSIP